MGLAVAGSDSASVNMAANQGAVQRHWPGVQEPLVTSTTGPIIASCS